jgi:hypothetical protein
MRTERSEYSVGLHRMASIYYAFWARCAQNKRIMERERNSIHIIIIIIIIIIIFNLRTAAFKAYCAIWVRYSNFRHQASPRVSPRQSTQRRKVELRARNVREFCLNADFHVIFRDLLQAVTLRNGTDGVTSPTKEWVLRIFFALKIRRLRPSANPRTWVPKASTLPLDHRSRYTLLDLV